MLVPLVKLVKEIALLLLSGMLAKKAVEAGLSVAPYIKTSLSPGSGVVSYYLQESGVLPFLEQLGFNNVGYGCMTCIGNSGPLPDNMVDVIEKVFYNRLHPQLKKKIVYLLLQLERLHYSVLNSNIQKSRFTTPKN
jgi:hypothetical protein